MQSEGGRAWALAVGLGFFLTTASTAQEAEKTAPIWEFGAGAGAVAYPDYRGSDRYRFLPFPLPSFVYRGDLLKYDDDGVRSMVLHSDYYKFDFSGSVGPPTHKDNPERKGMPPLRPALEGGVELRLHLWQHPVHKVDLEVAHRWVFTFWTDQDPANRGRTVTVPLRYQLQPPGRYNDTYKFIAEAGPIFGTRPYHQYYYGVKPQYATDERPAYAADGGYAGWGILFYASRRHDELWISGFAKYENLRGAAFADSPLIKTTNYWSAGVFFVYYLDASATMVVTTKY